MFLWDETIGTKIAATLEERVAAILASGVFPAMVVQDEISEEVSRA